MSELIITHLSPATFPQDFSHVPMGRGAHRLLPGCHQLHAVHPALRYQSLEGCYPLVNWHRPWKWLFYSWHMLTLVFPYLARSMLIYWLLYVIELIRKCWWLLCFSSRLESSFRPKKGALSSNQENSSYCCFGNGNILRARTQNSSRPTFSQFLPSIIHWTRGSFEVF